MLAGGGTQVSISRSRQRRFSVGCVVTFLMLFRVSCIASWTNSSRPCVNEMSEIAKLSGEELAVPAARYETIQSECDAPKQT
jgi:hypothetical protein